ncbi:MAG: hypothetical protein AB1656_22960 [Candidatus Omnitrophota bacterium]
MDWENAFPENISGLFLSGDAHMIYRAIQYSGDLCLEELQKTEKIDDFDEEMGEDIRRRVKVSMMQASQLRFHLNTVSNKIQRAQKLEILLRTWMGKENIHPDQFLEKCLSVLTDEWSNCSKSIREALNKLRPDINSSLECRIRLMSCWDVLLTCQQELLAEQIVHQSHRLSEIAILLQDAEAIQKIRYLLESVDIKVLDPFVLGAMPQTTEELRSLLEKEIQSLETSCRHLKFLRLEHLRLKTAQNELGVQYETLASNELPSAPAPPRKDKKKSESKRMVYPNRKG